MKHIIYPLKDGIILLLLSGCAYYRESSTWQPSSSLGSNTESYKPSTEPGVSPDLLALIEPSGTVNLHQAISLALMHNPELAGFAWEVRSAEVRALCAGIILNPELEIKQKKAKCDLITAKSYMDAPWGSSFPVFEDVEGDLDILKPAPALSELSAKVSKNPDIIRWDITIGQLQNALSLEKENCIPDLTIGAGFVHSNADQEITYKLGFAIPQITNDRIAVVALVARYVM